MPILLAVAGALGLTAPVIIRGETVALPTDYPSGMLNARKSAVVDVEVLVSPEGRAETCRLIGEVRGRNFVEKSPAGPLTCALMKKRARFTPARDADGQASYGIYRAWVSWKIGDALGTPQPAQVDLDVTVAALPANVRNNARVAVDLAVSADGKPGACVAATVTEPQATEIKSPPLARAACDTLAAAGNLSVITNAAGEAVATIRRMVARFVLDKPGPTENTLKGS